VVGGVDRNEIAWDADFFNHGCHSLLAVKLVQSIAETTGWDVPLTELLAAPTPKRFADPPGDPHVGHHRGHVAAADHRRHRNRVVQRPQRRPQPDRQTHRPYRLRVSQPDQPTTPDTMGLHPPHQAGAIQDQAATPLLILKSRLSTVRSGVIKERW